MKFNLFTVCVWMNEVTQSLWAKCNHIDRFLLKMLVQLQINKEYSTLLIKNMKYGGSSSQVDWSHNGCRSTSSTNKILHAQQDNSRSVVRTKHHKILSFLSVVSNLIQCPRQISYVTLRNTNSCVDLSGTLQKIITKQSKLTDIGLYAIEEQKSGQNQS